MEKIIVVGGGGHAKVIISILKKIEKYEIIGFTSLEKKEEIFGVPFLGSDEVLNEYFNKGVQKLALGLGQIKSSEPRRKIVNKLLEIGFDFPKIVSPDSIISEDVEIGNGTIIMNGVVVNCATCIGNFSIVNTNSSIDHDCNIGSFTHIAPGATLGGEVKVGVDVLIGIGTNVMQCTEICDGCIISAGSTVSKSLYKKGIYRGVPAKFIKEV